MKHAAKALRGALLLAWALAGGGITLAQPGPAQSRGALLYTTHCIACHTTQMHWRSDRLASDWASLTAQVRRWQGNAGLQWGDADVVEVTRYLNETIYNFPEPHSHSGARVLPLNFYN
jgi:mono/diheme cytochrome c family protein